MVNCIVVSKKGGAFIAYILWCVVLTGTLSVLEPSKKRIPVKAVFIVLLLSLILMAIALIAIILWRAFRKDKPSLQSASSSSDRLTSCSSAVNLMSHGSSPMPVYRGYLDSSVGPFSGKYTCLYFLDYDFSFLLKHVLCLNICNILLFVLSCLKDAFPRIHSCSKGEQAHYMEQ